MEENFGKLPKGTKLSVDNHYSKGEAISILDDEGMEIFTPLYGMNKEVKNRFNKVNFQYDEENNRYICPEGKILNFVSKTTTNKRYDYLKFYRCKNCSTCPYQKECCKNAKHKTITALPHDKLLQRIKEKMQTKEGQKTYNLRKQTVETSFGDIKHNKKFREFLLRGIKKVKTEWNLVCIASNLVKINNLLIRRSLAEC